MVSRIKLFCPNSTVAGRGFRTASDGEMPFGANTTLAQVSRHLDDCIDSSTALQPQRPFLCSPFHAYHFPAGPPCSASSSLLSETPLYRSLWWLTSSNPGLKSEYVATKPDVVQKRFGVFSGHFEASSTKYCGREPCRSSLPAPSFHIAQRALTMAIRCTHTHSHLEFMHRLDLICARSFCHGFNVQ